MYSNEGNLAASRDRHLAIGFRSFGNRVCYAWLDVGWMLAGCWLDAGLMLAGCWLDAGSMLAGCRLDAGWMPARCWLDAGQMLAGCWLDAGWLQIWAECACYLQLDGNLQVFIEIEPECESGAHVIQESSQSARVGHISYNNQARVRKWNIVYSIIQPECES
jgi:hypothetical protein